MNTFKIMSNDTLKQSLIFAYLSNNVPAKKKNDT